MPPKTADDQLLTPEHRLWRRQVIARAGARCEAIDEQTGERCTKAEPQHRFWGLYTHVWKVDVLREAYQLAKENRGAPGVDGVRFEQIEAEGVEGLLEKLSVELREKTYQPLPCRQVNIPKEGGKVRGLKIPSLASVHLYVLDPGRGQ